MKYGKINLKTIFLYLFSFVLLNMPNLKYYIGLNNYVILGGFISIYIIKYTVYEKDFFKYLKKRYIFYFIVCVFLSTVYYAVRTILAGTSMGDLKNMRLIQNLMPIVYLIGALILNYELGKIGYNSKDKLQFIIKVGIIQSFICILMYIFPSLKMIAENIFYSASNKEYNFYISNKRLYGICDGDYTYGFQIMYAMLSCLSFCYAYYYKEKKYYIFSIMTLLVTFSNGRSGIMIFMIDVMLFLTIVSIKNGQIVKSAKVFLMTIIIGICVYNLINMFIPNVAKLINHAITDITSFSDGKENTETGRLVEMMFLPKGADFIFGGGYRVLGNRGKEYGQNQSSDVGIVNDLFMGGLIYVLLLYGSYFYLYKKSRKECRENNMENIFLIICLMSVVLANIKGEFFRNSLLQQFTLIIIVFTLFNQKGKIKE